MTTHQTSQLYQLIAELGAIFERIATMEIDPVAPVEAEAIEEFAEVDGVIYV